VLVHRTYQYAALMVVLLLTAWGVYELHRPSARKVADEIGCHEVSASRPQSGLSQEICTFHGDRTIVWSLSRGSYSLQNPSWVQNSLMGDTWIIGCSRPDDCLAIRRKVGGDLMPAASLGTSVVIG
jgi:hypothetical protein